ncbi:hypothetical protein Tco_0858017 [Tanacetum coccineum]|uniref:Uncharacterized protein n=1 Tax=Tanacetum coccineum TaxID=301880 RepID=A0ABQ5B852_9ASTR
MSGSQINSTPPPHHLHPSSSQTPTQQTPVIQCQHQTGYSQREYDIWVHDMEHYSGPYDYPNWRDLVGNDESKKIAEVYLEATVLKDFIFIQLERLHQKAYDRFQSLLSQLEIHGAGVNSLSFDDQYNNIRVFENDVKGSTALSSSSQNVAFVSENTNNTNDVSTALLCF